MANSEIKKVSSNSTIIVIFSSIAILYFIGQFISALSNNIETVSASYITYQDSISATGWFVRDEVVIDGTNSDTVEHIAENGQKVHVGSNLAVEYDDVQTLQLSREIDVLDDEILLLETAINSSFDLSDTAKLDLLIANEIRAISSQMTSGSVVDLRENATSLRQQVLRRGIDSSDIPELQSELNIAYTEKARLERAMSTNINYITSPCQGYFTQSVDGYENILTVSDLEDMSIENYYEKTKSEPENFENSLGKIAQNFQWYFMILLPSKDIEGLQENYSYTLSFQQISQSTKATLVSIETEGDNSLLIFRGTEIKDEFLSMRTQVVEIVKAEYSGIRIPKSAVRTDSSDNLGVYTLSGSVTRFKKIETIFEGDTYYIVKYNSTSETGLVIQDSIIVKGKGIEDKKVIK